MPAAHLEHALKPSWENWPPTQLVQLADEAAPTVSRKVPAEQAAHVVASDRVA